MLSLISLKFNNIGRFVTEQTIDFTQFDKLVQVNGSNKNTGGSSGAAKSTVFHALDYLLGINDIPATALQSRLTKDPITVEGDFLVGTTPLNVKRSKKEGLTITFGDESISGNVKLAEERLEEIIGIPKKLFKKMVHKKQKEGGFFLNLTAKESYDFLMNALGLEKTGEQTAKIDENIKAINTRVIQLGHSIEAFSNSINEIEEMMEFEKPPTCNLNKDDLAKQLEVVDQLNQEIISLSAQHKEQLDNLTTTKPLPPISIDSTNNFILPLEDKIRTLRDEKQKKTLEHLSNKRKLSTAIDDLKSKMSQIPHAKATIDRLVSDVKELLAQKAHIEESKCPTCMQQWIGSGVEAKINSINLKLNEHKVAILEKKKIVDGENELSSQLTRLTEIIQKIDLDNHTNELDEQINSIQQEIATIKAQQNNQKQAEENKYLTELNEYNQKLQTLKDNHSQLINPHISRHNELRQDITNKELYLQHFEQSSAIFNEKMQKYNKTLEDKRANLADAVLQKEQKTKELSVAEETKRLIKTYTLQIFQDTLDYIGNYATQILSDIPNMVSSTIYFEGCKENKTGTIKDEVNAIVNMDGYDNINIKTLSGGERTVIDLAVDLAVIDMIESKAGMGADFFILDEPFDGLEDINISQCLEVLKQVDTNKKIVIVDHNPIAKEMITDSILVERDGEESVVL